MASQIGVIKIQGTIGDLVFSKNGNVSRKPQGNKAAFASAPSRQRTRENASEFGMAAKYGKLLRDSLRGLVTQASDFRVTSRLTKTMREIIGLDDTSDRGQRVYDATNSAPLLDFDFNDNAGLAQTVFVPLDIVATAEKLVASYPDIDPRKDIMAPQGATHFQLVFGASSLDMETLKHETARGADAPILPLNAVSAAGDITVAFVAAPPAANLVVGVIGVNFYQQMNGKFYALNNNTYNPLAVKYVD